MAADPDCFDGRAAVAREHVGRQHVGRRQLAQRGTVALLLRAPQLVTQVEQGGQNGAQATINLDVGRGVKLKAGAPSIHMLRVDIDTEISPMVGDEKQSKDLIAFLSGEDPEKLWQSNIFGKSVYELIQEGLNTKLVRTPEDVRAKFRGSLTRIVNEGATGLICLIL